VDEEILKMSKGVRYVLGGVIILIGVALLVIFANPKNSVLGYLCANYPRAFASACTL
jgi:hypothetical protein